MKTGLFLIIPVPFILLTFFVLFNLSDNGNIRIPDGIENAPLDEQLRFGKKALQSGQYELAEKHCGAALSSEDVNEKMIALICVSSAYEKQSDLKQAIESTEQLRDLKLQSGLDVDVTDERLAELRKRL